MIDIRQATADEAADCAPLFDAYRQFYGKASDLNGAETFLRERLGHGESIVLIASAANRDVGFMQLYPTYSSLSMRKQWILNDLYVMPEARGQGVAKRLLAEAFELARRTGAKGLSLQTASDNRTAQRLYESLGFVRDEEFWTYDWQA
ncbi:GNAT family N-acetyltransferase [Paenibacillus sp. TRM 82003]|nr:GNAT family N-acetyltransferase [Paenibacillus sp. TRM 82003]